MTNYISRTGAQRPNGAPHFEGDVVDVDAIVGTTTVMCFFFSTNKKVITRRCCSPEMAELFNYENAPGYNDHSRNGGPHLIKVGNNKSNNESESNIGFDSVSTAPDWLQSGRQPIRSSSSRVQPKYFYVHAVQDAALGFPVMKQQREQSERSLKQNKNVTTAGR